MDLKEKLKEVEEAPTVSESLATNYKKWDMMEQQAQLEEEREVVDNADYTKEAQVKEMFGCSRDHSKEIDIYNKSNQEKMARILHFKEEGNQHFQVQAYDKSSYYYAQALLIFHYLIPESNDEERETETVKRVIHRDQAISFMKQGRNREAI